MPTFPSASPPLQGGKRQRDSTKKDHKTLSPLPPWKRSREPLRSAAETTTAYWDNFSEIILTQSALEELDRRAHRPRRIEWRVYRASKAVRQRGLGLRHLRGVRYTQDYSRL